MKYYLSLQIKFFNRHIKANDIHPAFAYIFLLAVFIFFSVYLFNQTEYAPYIYFFIPIPVWGWLTASKRNSFLKTSFTPKTYRSLRALENLTVAFPFAAFLAFKNHYLVGFSILFMGIIFSFFQVKKQGNFTIPTPFYKYPFEFTAGFRRNFLFIISSWILTGIGIIVNNFNLSVFGLILIFLCGLSFYTLPENKFFIWIYSKNPNQFLFHKIKIAFWYILILSAPCLISLLIFFPEKCFIILAFQGIGFLIVCESLLGKYAVYPAELNLPQALAIAFSVLFPPLLVVLLPLFYWLSLKKLNPILK